MNIFQPAPTSAKSCGSADPREKNRFEMTIHFRYKISRFQRSTPRFHHFQITTLKGLFSLFCFLISLSLFLSLSSVNSVKTPAVLLLVSAQNGSPTRRIGARCLK